MRLQQQGPAPIRNTCNELRPLLTRGVNIASAKINNGMDSSAPFVCHKTRPFSIEGASQIYLSVIKEAMHGNVTAPLFFFFLRQPKKCSVN